FRSAVRARLPDVVELFVQIEGFLEQARGRARGTVGAILSGETFETEQVVDAGRLTPKRPECVVQVRRPLQTGAPLGRAGVVKIVRMKLAADRPEAPLEISLVDRQLSGQAEKREVIVVPAQRKQLMALRTEMNVDGCVAAAVPTHLHRHAVRQA